jgi:hypothetical protein
MKKIALIVSAISAGLFSAAHADISVSGSAGVGVSSGLSASGTQITNGAAVSFALSSDLGNGVVVSTSAGISLDSNDAALLSTVGATGLSNLTFTTGSTSFTIGGDVDIAGDGVGEVGGVAGDLVDEGDYNAGAVGMGGLAQEDGYGMSVTTAVGGGTLTASYILDAEDVSNNAVTDETDTASGIQVSMPLGDITVTVGASSDDDTSTGGSQAGAQAAMSIMGGSVTAGMAEFSPTSGTSTSTWGLSYAGTFAGANMSLGYTSGTSGTNKSTRTEVSLSQSIGAGASVFLDISTGSGYTTGTNGSNIAVGTTFTF